MARVVRSNSSPRRVGLSHMASLLMIPPPSYGGGGPTGPEGDRTKRFDRFPLRPPRLSPICWGWRLQKIICDSPSSPAEGLGGGPRVSQSQIPPLHDLGVLRAPR